MPTAQVALLRIRDYLAAATEHLEIEPLGGAEFDDEPNPAQLLSRLTGLLFRAVSNNIKGKLVKPLNPKSVYDDVVIHYSKKSG